MNNSAGLFKQFRFIYKTCCSVNCGFHVTSSSYDLMVRARTFRVRSIFVNVKFSVLIYVKNYTYGGAITFIALYLPLILARLDCACLRELVINCSVVAI